MTCSDLRDSPTERYGHWMLYWSECSTEAHVRDASLFELMEHSFSCFCRTSYWSVEIWGSFLCLEKNTVLALMWLHTMILSLHAPNSARANENKTFYFSSSCCKNSLNKQALTLFSPFRIICKVSLSNTLMVRAAPCIVACCYLCVCVCVCVCVFVNESNCKRFG